jgi:hypothetical protein
MYARALAAAWVVALIVGTRPALGAVPEVPIDSESAAPATSAALAVANVSVHGSAEERTELEAILRDLLANRAVLSVGPNERVDAPQVLRASRLLTPHGDVVAWVWIELDDTEQVALYVADSEGARILVRHVQRANTPSEIVLESAARIVVTAIEALLQGERIGVPREEVVRAPPSVPPTKPLSKPPARSEGRPRLTWRAGAFYGVQLFAPKLTLLQGPGALLGGALGSGRLRLGATLTAQVWLPRSVSDSAVNLELFSTSPRLLVSADYAPGARVALSAGLGGGVDLTQVRPSAAAGSTGVHPSAAETLITAELRAAAGASLRVANGLSLALLAYFDTDLSRTRYVVDSSGSQSAFLRPWPVRPGLMLGVTTP